MPAERDTLRKALDQYISETFTYIHTVKNFSSSEWIQNRETELETMIGIKKRARRIHISFSQLIKSENKRKDTPRLIRNAFTSEKAKREQTELQEELAASVNDTLRGLKELEHFLDAVEKLAVTSGQVFKENNQVSVGADLESVQNFIGVAKVICPVLITFKRDAEVFFSPRLQNVEVLQYQLEHYVRTVQKVCSAFKNSFPTELCLKEPLIDLKEDLSEDDIEKMLSHINEINNIRTDEHFRTVFLFQDEYQSFMTEFRERRPQMLGFLGEVEACAVQLDKMNKGKKISNVVGSSVGIFSGVLTIMGLALIPFNTELSLGLRRAGAVLGGLSGVNSIITTLTEIIVNSTQQNKACETFEKFMENVSTLQKCLDELIYRYFHNPQDNPIVESLLLNGKAISVMRSFDFISDYNSVVQSPPDLSIGGFSAVNVLFIGIDVFVIVSNTGSLFKGNETEFSKSLRTRAALCHSEIDSWQKICDSLEKAQVGSEENKAILNKAFCQAH